MVQRSEPVGATARDAQEQPGASPLSSGGKNDENAYRRTSCGEELHTGVQSPLIATKQPAKAEEWMNKLSEEGIEAKRPVFRPHHRIFGLPGDFPTAEKHWRRSLSIPIYPTLSEEERERVIEAILEICESP